MLVSLCNYRKCKLAGSDRKQVGRQPLWGQGGGRHHSLRVTDVPTILIEAMALQMDMCQTSNVYSALDYISAKLFKMHVLKKKKISQQAWWCR